jgi:methylated-DNA-protein-cysteine methyltransferase-like protein
MPSKRRKRPVVAVRGAPRTQTLDPAAARQREIRAVVAAIPRGRVATYGQIAELAGIASGHRLVARVMRSCPAELPWQRVVGKKDARRAQIAIQDAEHAAEQRARLKAEGVEFDANGCIVLVRYGWLPQD